MVKQVIVMRTDLGMRKGKMIAQGSHASMKVLLDERWSAPVWEKQVLGPQEATWSLAEIPGAHRSYLIGLDDAKYEWLTGLFTKICVQVGSKEELLALLQKAQECHLPCALIEDSGLTEFHGNKTATCIAIGPADAEVIDKITGHLKLL